MSPLKSCMRPSGSYNKRRKARLEKDGGPGQFSRGRFWRGSSDSGSDGDGDDDKKKKESPDMIKLKIERINQKIKILDFESAILKETEQEDAAMLKELKAEANKELIKTNALIQLYSGITAIADTILKGDFEAAKEKTVEVLTKKYDLKRIEDGEKELLAQWFMRLTQR